MPGSGFKITPGDLHQSGSTLRGFGDQVAKGGDKLRTLGEHLVSHAGKDKSGVGAAIAKALGKGTEVAGKVFSEGGRVAGAAGKRLHGNASAHESNESGVSKSFHDLHDPKSTAKSPKTGGSNGSNGKPSANGGGKNYHEPTKSPKAAGATGKGNTTAAADRTYCGDPIDVSTGRMILTQVDVELAGLLRLVLSRTHVSGYRIGRWFGTAWSSTVDQRLAVDDDGVHLVAEDGRVLSYPDGAQLPVAGARWPLRRIDNGYVVTDPDAERRYYFTGDGLPLRGIADGDGNQIDLDYDAAGTLTELRHSGGYRIAVRTDDGLITALRLHGTTLVEYRYDEQRQLTEVVNSAGTPMRFTYDAAGRIVHWADRNGMWYGYHFDERGRCVRAEGANGYLNVSLAYDDLVTSATNSLGHTTTYQLNEQLQVVGETDPLGNTTTFEWSPHDELLARTDPLGRTTRYGYDDAGHVTEVTRPDGSKALARYDEQGRRLAMIGPDGAVWRREYDPAGKLRREIDPTGATTDYAYDSVGAIAAITDAIGNVTRYESNAIGLPLTVTDPLGAVLRYEYDPSGRVRTVTDPLGAVTRLAWTVEGAPRERIDPDGSVWRWDHDGEGNNVETVDANNGRTRTEYAHFDLPVAETGPDGARLAYAYDTELRLVSVTNAQGLMWRYEYDPAGNLVAETDFNGRVPRYEYDAAGQLVGQVTGAGERITIERDALGRVIRRADAMFGYDPAGRLVLARNDDAEVTIDYDAAGRVVGESVNRRTVRAEFDRLGRRIRLVTPAGRESVWEYDAADRPTLLRTPGRVQRFGWDPAGRQVSRELGGAVVRQEWDVNDRLRGQTVLAGDQVLQRGYAYHANGFLSSVTDSLSGARQLDVDAAGRVTAVHGNGWQERYAYDPAGFPTMAGWPARANAVGPRRYAGTLLVSAGDVRYQHDREGRIVRRSSPTETWRYQWNADSRLVSVSTPDGHTWRYRYDALGRRVAKQRFDADGRLLEQIDFTWDGAELVEQVHGGPARPPIVTTWDWEPGADRPVSQAERPLGGSTERSHAIVTDTVGSPTELVDDNGNLAWHAHTSLWGVTLSSADYTPLRFPGQYHDRETGLHYNLHRYYDPETGRYLTHDPLGLAEGPDTLVYVGNPTEWIDPLGLAKCQTAAASGAGGGGGGKKPPGRFTPYSKPVVGKAPRKRKYRIGSHGAKKTEQQRLGQEFGTKVSGATHESEHPIGYEVLGNRTGVPRGTSGQATSIENHAPAYQEAEPAHTSHIGTGNRVHPQAVGTSAFHSSDEYRQHQWNALNDTAEGGRNNVSNAVQLNQLDYAHQQSFHNTTGTQAGQIADNSYHHMVDQHVGHGVGFAAAPGITTNTHPVDHTAAAEMHLGRDTIRNQEYPTEQQRSDALYPSPTQAQRDAQAAADGFPPGTYDPPAAHDDPMDVDE